MIKVFGFLKRRSDLTLQQFSDYWHNNHVALADRIVPKDALSRVYIQNHALAMKGGGEAPYDAVAELCFDDRAHMQRWIDWYGSEAGQELRDDELNFMDVSKRVIVVTDERVMRGR